jgi:hypothetical protein
MSLNGIRLSGGNLIANHELEAFVGRNDTSKSQTWFAWRFGPDKEYIAYAYWGGSKWEWTFDCDLWLSGGRIFLREPMEIGHNYQIKWTGAVNAASRRRLSFTSTDTKAIGVDTDGMYITTDDSVRWQKASDDSLLAILTINTDRPSDNCSGGFKAGKVFNAVWNDVADFQPIDPDKCQQLIPGKVYIDGPNGIQNVTKRNQAGIAGIYSDTYGIGVGEAEDRIPIAIGGWVLAYTDKQYPTGTPLVTTRDGFLTKARFHERILTPERIVATYARSEDSEKWGPEGKEILVCGRNWVKVK